MDMQKLVPPGSSGKPAKSGGTCVVCGKEQVTRSQMVVRALYWDHDHDQEMGHKVCTSCSPYVSDVTVERYTMDYDDWDWRWKMNLDPGVFTFNGRTVTAEW